MREIVRSCRRPLFAVIANLDSTFVCNQRASIKVFNFSTLLAFPKKKMVTIFDTNKLHFTLTKLDQRKFEIDFTRVLCTLTRVKSIWFVSGAYRSHRRRVLWLTSASLSRVRLRDGWKNYSDTPRAINKPMERLANSLVPILGTRIWFLDLGLYLLV